MSIDPAKLRSTWEALLAAPTRDDLATRLESVFDRELEGARQVLRRAAPPARAEALGRLFYGAFGFETVGRRARFVGPYVNELRDRLAPKAGDAPADDAARGDEALPEPDPEPDPSDPFFAWALGDLAANAPEAVRAPLVDRAVEAFDAIVSTPISPGNDAGPFARFAHVMSAAQARRALAVTERMEASGWGGPGREAYGEDIARSRGYLIARLADLGRLDEAEALLPSILLAEPRAETLGRVRAHRARHGGGWAPPFAAGPAPRRECLLATLRGLTSVFEGPAAAPPEAVVADCLARVAEDPDVETRSGALTHMKVAGWYAVGPPSRWSSALVGLASGERRVDALFSLASVWRTSDEGPALARLAVDHLLTLSGYDLARWTDEVYAVRGSLPAGELPARFAEMVITTARSPRSPRSRLLQAFHLTYDLEPLLRYLGGDDAPGAVAAALDELVRALG